jgi:hypothetical protein
MTQVDLLASYWTMASGAVPHTDHGMKHVELEFLSARLCGEGEFDVRGFVTIMLNAGYTGPWGIEALNSELRTWPPARIAERAPITTLAQFPA